MPLDPCSNVLEQTTHPLTIIYPSCKFRTYYRYFQAHLRIMHTFLPSSKKSGIFGVPLGVPFHSTCDPPEFAGSRHATGCERGKYLIMSISTPFGSGTQCSSTEAKHPSASDCSSSTAVEAFSRSSRRALG